MKTIISIVSAMVGGIAGFVIAGFGAVSLLVPILGDHDGGTSMGGFFGFGPIGALAGALLGIGLALRFRGGPASWSKGLLIGAGAVTVLGGILLAFAAAPERSASYSYVIEFQLEVPAASLAGIDIPGPNATWGAAAGDSDDKPISQFFGSTCQAETCLLNGSVAALGSMQDFHIRAKFGQKEYRYPLGVPIVISGPTDWSAWRDNEDGRIRWRIAKK